MFRTFWFEANQAWGKINNINEWKRIVKTYKKGWGEDTNGAKLMKSAHATIETEKVENGEVSATKNYMPNFGLYSEHKSSMSLEEWAKKNDMYDTLNIS